MDFPSRCGAVFPPVPCPSQVHRKGDLGDEVDGMKGRHRRVAGRRWLPRETRGVCAVVTSVTTRQFQCGCWAENGDVGDIVKSLNDAGVLTMPTRVSCVPPVNHQTKLVSIFRRPTELDYKRYGLPKSHQEDSYRLTKSAKKPSEFHSYSGKAVARKDASVYHKNRNDRACDGLGPYLVLPPLR